MKGYLNFVYKNEACLKQLLKLLTFNVVLFGFSDDKIAESFSLEAIVKMSSEDVITCCSKTFRISLGVSFDSLLYHVILTSSSLCELCDVLSSRCGRYTELSSSIALSRFRLPEVGSCEAGNACFSVSCQNC